MGCRPLLPTATSSPTAATCSPSCTTAPTIAARLAELQQLVARRRASRSSPRATCITTSPRGWRCTTCSPRSATARPSPPLEERCLFPNAERHLRPLDEIAHALRRRAGRRRPHASKSPTAAASRSTSCATNIPRSSRPPGQTPLEYLTQLTWQGAAERYPGRHSRQSPPAARARAGADRRAALRGVFPHRLGPRALRPLAEHPLPGPRLGGQLGRLLSAWASRPSIPTAIDVLFERFISRERNEAPDIDVDFEHERREEVLQYLYDKYGRERAGMTADGHHLSHAARPSATSARRSACRSTASTRWPSTSKATRTSRSWSAAAAKSASTRRPTSAGGSSTA